MPFVGELLLLVIDPNHDRFGQIADFEANDWEGGKLLGRFPDGTSMTLYDGLDNGVPAPPQVLKVPKHLGDAVTSHQVDVMSIRHRLRSLWQVATDEKLPVDVRLEAKKQIFNQVSLPRFTPTETRC